MRALFPVRCRFCPRSATKVSRSVKANILFTFVVFLQYEHLFFINFVNINRYSIAAACSVIKSTARHKPPKWNVMPNGLEPPPTADFLLPSKISSVYLKGGFTTLRRPGRRRRRGAALPGLWSLLENLYPQTEAIMDVGSTSRHPLWPADCHFNLY